MKRVDTRTSFTEGGEGQALFPMRNALSQMWNAWVCWNLLRTHDLIHDRQKRLGECMHPNGHKSTKTFSNGWNSKLSAWWVLNRFTNCIASKFMLCFTSILCCFNALFTSCPAKHYLLFWTLNTMSSDRLQLIMYFISHIKLLRFARRPRQLDPIPNMQKQSYENLSEILRVCVLCVCTSPSKAVCVCVVCAQTNWYSSQVKLLVKHRELNC